MKRIKIFILFLVFFCFLFSNVNVEAKDDKNDTKPGKYPDKIPPPDKYYESIKEYLKYALEVWDIIEGNMIIYYEYFEFIDDEPIKKYKPYKDKNKTKSHNPSYGEDSDALGQFVDNYYNLSRVMINEDVVKNVTIDALELNSSLTVEIIYDNPYYREHDFYAGQIPDIDAYIGANEYLVIDSTNAGIGKGHFYINANRNWLSNKYLRWSWNCWYSGGVNKQPNQMYIVDYEWDRTNDADFPEGSLVGEQLETYLITPAYTAWSGWIIEDYQMNNVSTGISENVSISLTLTDMWVAQNLVMVIDWIEINMGAGGAGNLFRIDFNDSTNVVVEQGGTQDDYGYVNNTGTPFMSGVYVDNGYYITTDYLVESGVDGGVLTQLFNTTIPNNCVVTAQFSNDSIAWVNSNGALGYDSLGGGFEAIDLRNLNYSGNYYLMVNLSSNDILSSPRIYQSRLITHENGIVFAVGINSATILMLILLFALAILIYWGIKRR